MQSERARARTHTHTHTHTHERLQTLLEDAILSQEAIARTLLPKDDPLLDELIEEFNADKDRMECVLKTLGILRGGADEACGYVACHHERLFTVLC
jgi:uncharacterized membrane protein YccC